MKRIAGRGLLSLSSTHTRGEYIGFHKLQAQAPSLFCHRAEKIRRALPGVFIHIAGSPRRLLRSARTLGHTHHATITATAQFTADRRDVKGMILLGNDSPFSISGRCF